MAYAALLPRHATLHWRAWSATAVLNTELQALLAALCSSWHVNDFMQGADVKKFIYEFRIRALARTHSASQGTANPSLALAGLT
jgi:hypothetical protein